MCAAVAAAEDAGLRRVLEADPGDPLLAWAWDGGDETPATFATASMPIDYGAVAPGPASALHLGFDEGAGGTLHDLSPAGRRIDAEGARWEPGRFGFALASLPAPPIPAAPTTAPFFGDVWTLELWVRPDGAGPGPQGLVAESGSFELRLDPELRPVLSLRVGDETVGMAAPAPLEPGRWNHVAVACDAAGFGHLRLVVNGSGQVKRLPADAVGPGEGVLRLGGGAGTPALRGALDQVRIERRAAPTTELLAWGAPDPAPGAHTLRLRFRSGPRTETLWAHPTRWPRMRGEAAWRAGDLQGVAADAEGIRWAPARWERARPPQSPTPRTTHPTVYVGDHRAFLFGGEVRDSHFPPMVNTADTWLYEIDARRWVLAQPPSAPPPRCHQAAAYSPDHDLLLMVGGWRNDGPEKPLLSDVWVYHVGENRWEERPPADVRLPTQSDSGVVYHAGLRRFLLFRQHEIYQYDPAADRWSRRPAPEVVDPEGRRTRLAGRVSPIMGYDPDTGLTLRFGGAAVVGGERIYTDTTALYDAGANRWTVLKPAVAPAPRVRGALAYDGARRRFVLFGGVRDQFSERYGDLWTFDVETRRWSPLDDANAPSPRGGYYGMAWDPGLDEFVLAAGRPEHAVLLDETWHLRIRPERPGTATYVFDRAGFEGADRWFDASVQPEGSRVRIRFAGSGDARSWGPWVPRPHLLEPRRARYVKVELELTPGPEGAAPRVASMGFYVARGAGGAGGPEADTGSDAFESKARVLPLEPYRSDPAPVRSGSAIPSDVDR